MEKHKYLGKTVKSERYMNTEIKCVGTVCYYLDQSCFAFHSLFQEPNIKMSYVKLHFLAAPLYGCETRSLIQIKKHRMRMFEKRVLSTLLGPQRKKVPGQNKATVRAMKTLDIASRLHTPEMSPDVFPIFIWKE